MSARAANPFQARVVLAIIVLGAAAFLLFLYAVGQGGSGRDIQDGGAHALSRALNGFAGLVVLSEANGFEPDIGYSGGHFNDNALLVLTPQHALDAEELDQILLRRRDIGPTLVILPKWIVGTIPDDAIAESQPGWVWLSGPRPPDWFYNSALGSSLNLGLFASDSWAGLGLNGALADPTRVQAVQSTDSAVMTPLVRSDSLADPTHKQTIQSIDRVVMTPLIRSDSDAFLAARFQRVVEGDEWPVTYVFEPDLMNNYGLANHRRAQAALRLLREAGAGSPAITFDLTLAGFGTTRNLLTLAFAPPFLAATLILLLVALLVAWRGFSRFGPAVVAAPARNFGKRALASNTAALIARVQRWHLLTGPYADMIITRLAAKLASRHRDRAAQIRAIEAALERKGYEGPGFGATVERLRVSSHPRETLREAKLLRHMERML